MLVGQTPTGDLSVASTNVSALVMLYLENIVTHQHNTLTNTDGSVLAEPSSGVLAIGYLLNGYAGYWNPPSGGFSDILAGLPINYGVIPSGGSYWTLTPGRSYRLVFTGEGPNLTGSVYDLADLTKPLGTVSGDTSRPSATGLLLPRADKWVFSGCSPRPTQ